MRSRLSAGGMFQLYVVLASLAFGALFVLARSAPYLPIDLAVERMVQSFSSRELDMVMLFVTGLGFHPLASLLSGLVILYLIVIGLRWEAFMALFAAGGVTLLGALIKVLVRRQRPLPDLVNVFSNLNAFSLLNTFSLLNDYSFPSGHVLLYTAFLGFLCFLFFTLAPHTWRRTLGMVVTMAFIVLVGLSRVYLGQHWPSDVAGAYLLGSVWLALTVYVYRRGKLRFLPHPPDNTCTNRRR